MGIMVRPDTSVDLVLHVTSDGAGVAGQSATINIYRERDWTKVIDDAAMTDRGAGLYSYSFAVGADFESYTAVMKVAGLYATEQYEEIFVTNFRTAS